MPQLHRQVNKGKRSVALDLTTDAGRSVLYRLAANSDAFVTNMTEARSRSLGVAYEHLVSHNPGIVYCRNTGYGATGPYADVPTHGQMMDGLAGATPVEMGEDGLVRPARWSGRQRINTLEAAGEGTSMSGLYAALYVAAALAGRGRSKRGAALDVSASACVLASAWAPALAALDPSTHAAGDDEAASRGVARYQYYGTADGRFVLFCPEEQKFWEGFCDLVERPELKPLRYGEDLRRELQRIFSTRTLEQWMEVAIANQLPIGPVHSTIAQVDSDPQIRARRVILESTSISGTHLLAPPVLVADQPYVEPTPAPELGQDTESVLRELGYTPGQIAELAATYVTNCPQGRHATHPDVFSASKESEETNPS
ncbi:putative acyl-CoA transferase/carnitine dehydratase [Mycobacterium intracellulare subsp. chimaera]|nr:putative acyl-CoA transferase/carnitine dehydratase [Mycobacterium intracellulare subsp. chimaera]